MDSGKIERVLDIYTKLMSGNLINKAEEAQNYGVNERTIQRDIGNIRNYLDSEFVKKGDVNSIIYDRIEKVYRLEQTNRTKFTNGEVLAICRILLDSRSLTKNEMYEVLDKVISCCTLEKNQKAVKELISNEKYHYVEPRHKKEILDLMWDIGIAIRESKYIVMDYERIKDKTIVSRKVKPVSIMFSEYYFYLAAFIDDKEVQKKFDAMNDSYPTIYRIDRIEKLEVLKERFRIPYSDRFEEGEFRKRVQFMYGGKLQRVRFKYSGNDIDSVLDRLPTARIISEEEGIYTISAEVLGKGIDMWLRSQGELVFDITY